MKRVIIICEGETEKEFCTKILSPFFASKHIFIQSPLIKKSMGGIVKWNELKKQITLHLKNEKTAFVTTLIDYYGLYKKYQFPGWDESLKITDKNARMDFLEKMMSENIEADIRNRYLPYIQLHEFEGLLFNDINVFYEQIPKNELIGIAELKQTFNDYDNPEMINDKKETSPSHRLERIIKGYNKIIYGNFLADAIGLDKICKKSIRFNNWLQKIENL
ncbi:MAG: hypothetical protein A2X13_07645 [Bacteroidetes bacterium GWC2_33_15]|nr:MAG: hypothetical protein A2X10_01500 [Bacteroidetes bacterium GWA2_33_15]OFX48659.1 MAG: hypothetical protein A2X13_07645 [Bacteroidetes bacterium GWC2_33_15]OFX64633.1 MAG: hypothetical protein A2X15_05235 [Bacteroidetes bacterium GWB2_32_14]OFX67949.1 MAG: hypothetical protein A2X14_01540 [Bacteroidetes bacterium GWD2_33_33]HAN18180.1 hypothetical protein [Bacteroidales bacterium]